MMSVVSLIETVWKFGNKNSEIASLCQMLLCIIIGL
jgi:hypothetical protein